MTDLELSGSWNRVEIDLDSLRYNYRSIRDLAGVNVRVMAVIKSDAYGHGMVEAARTLALEGATVFGVAETNEGVSLREAGIKGDIVVLLGCMAENYADIIAYDLTPVVFNRETLKGLAGRAANEGKEVGVHLKIDTGMGRLGILPHQMPEYLDILDGLKGVKLAGVLSHFPMADSSDPSGTDEQGREFAVLMKDVKSRFGNQVAHIANSAAIIRNTGSHMNMVRPGIALYGYCPSPADDFCASLALRPVMSFKSRVIQVKDVPAGTGISYGHTYTTTRPTRLAVIPVGYDNGYLRTLSGRALVLIGGKKLPVLGRICMNACMVDVTDLDHAVKAGDEVVLLGRQGQEQITADEIASWLETISYEVLCLLGGKNRKIYI